MIQLFLIIIAIYFYVDSDNTDGSKKYEIAGAIYLCRRLMW